MASPKLTDFKRANDSYEAVPIVLEDLVKMPQVFLNIWQRGSFDFEQGTIYVPAPIFVTSDKAKALVSLIRARNNDEAETLKNCDFRIKTIKGQMKYRSAPPEQRAQFAQVEKVISDLQQDYI